MLGHSVLYAPAGAGKTHWIMEQVNNLVDSGVSPESIYCITFTNRARDNLKARVNNKVNISTSHSLYWNNIKSEYILIDEYTYQYIVTSILKLTNIELSLGRVLKELDYMRNLAFFNTYETSYEMYRNYIYSSEFVKEYTNKKLNASNKKNRLSSLECTLMCELFRNFYNGLGHTYVDFTELTIICNFNLKLKATHVFIDEFQDTTFSEMMSLLNCFKGANVHLLCDLNQSIYVWRGARAEYNLKKFRLDYVPEEITMDTVYRYGSDILDIGNKLLGYCVAKPAIDKPSNVNLVGYDSLAEECIEICRGVYNDFINGKSVCVLGRTNKYLQQFISQLQRLDVPISYRSTVAKSRYELFSIMRSVYGNTLNEFDDVLFKSVRNGVLVTDMCCKSSGYSKPNNKVPLSFILYGINYLKTLCYSGKKIVVFDVETTGLDFTQDRIIQLSAVRLNGNFTFDDQLDIIVNPNKSVGDSVYTHHFTDEYIKENGTAPLDAILRFKEFSNDCLFVGHNINYDRTMLHLEFERLGMCWDYKDNMFYDTLSLSRYLYKAKSFKLCDLNNQLKLGANPNHNALDDVIATAELLKHNVATLHSRWKHVELDIDLSKSNKANSITIDLIDCMRGENPLDNVDKFKQVLAKHGIGRDCINDLDFCVSGIKEQFKNSLIDYTSRVAFRELLMLDRSVINTTNVQVLTVHQSKGLGFDSVYIVENNLKTSNKESDEDIRVQYVATTRTKRDLTVSYLVDQPYNSLVSVMKG